MSGSPFFARIKADVLRILAAVPAGRLVSFRDVGAHLDVMPRHVAYILATLRPEEAEALPWHRGVPADGRLGAAATVPRQRGRLEAEGIAFAPDGRIADFEARLVPVAALPHGVPAQRRPASAPAPARRRR